MTKTTSTHAAAAKAIRAELKKNGIKASVRSESYSMGNSVNVTINQDVTPTARKEIEAFCNRFQYGHFDGMTDCYEYSNSNKEIPQVKFVFVRVEYSDEIKQAAADYIANISGIEEHEQDRYAFMALNGSWGDFWTAHKPRIRAAA
jgi:hypothetical protein